MNRVFILISVNAFDFEVRLFISPSVIQQLLLLLLPRAELACQLAIAL